MLLLPVQALGLRQVPYPIIHIPEEHLSRVLPPWLANAHAKAPLQLAETSDTPSEISELPASLRGLRQNSPSLEEHPSEESPIILIT